METLKEGRLAVAAAVGLLTGLWGWLGWLTVGWVACMALDYVTGSAAAAKEGAWSSAKAREGIWHKMGMVVVVVAAAGADLLMSAALEHLPMLELPVEYPGLLCPVVLVWYIVTELGSMVENAVVMGAAVPQWLRRLLAVSRDAIGQAVDGQDNGPTDESEGKEE